MWKNDDHADSLPEWDLVLSAAALYARHRVSRDADHVIGDLQERFDKVLEQIESVAGWKTARVKRPVMILGSLDGIETGIRQLIRSAPLETKVVEHKGAVITVPKEEEMLRIKAVLILKRNATRDYLDFVALSVALGDERVAGAMESFDRLYPQPSGESALQQLQAQLLNPMHYDLKEVKLSEYKNLDPKWHDWNRVAAAAAHLGGVIFDRAAEAGDEQEQGR